MRPRLVLQILLSLILAFSRRLACDNNMNITGTANSWLIYKISKQSV